MNVYELADALEKIETYNQVIHRSFNDKTKLTASADILRQQADRIAELEKGEEVAGRFYWESVVDGHVMAVPSEGTPHYNKDDFPLYTTPQIKELSDEELNKAFDYYCETDEGVLRFNYELRDEWKKEQLIRWKEALKLAEIFEEVGRAKYPYHLDAAEMLRRLVEELDALNAKESMWQEMIEDLECQVIKYKQGEPFHDFNTLTLDTGEKRSLKPLSEYAQYDRGFDDGVKHGKEIYEAEIVELKAQTKPLKLSYEQINQVASRFSLNGFSYIDFAEAILEEASK